MSSICLCFTDIKEKNEILFCQNCLNSIANKYGRGISFSINWHEPIVECLKDRYMFISFTDAPNLSNCEMLLLPDGWYYNGDTNETPFIERMQFLQSIAEFLIMRNHKVDFYIGLSGTNPYEYLETSVEKDIFAEYLMKTVGQDGIEDGIDRHIVVIP